MIANVHEHLSLHMAGAVAGAVAGAGLVSGTQEGPYSGRAKCKCPDIFAALEGWYDVLQQLQLFLQRQGVNRLPPR